MRVYCLALLLLIFACTGPSVEKSTEPQLFTLLPGEETGMDFINQLDFIKDFNIYTYRNFYNGGGVAVGDLKGDGLDDLYFTANMAENRLYINQGGMKFRNATTSSGAGGCHHGSC